MDTELDNDPAEQRRRDAAERLTDLRADLADMMHMWLEERRDRKEWDGSQNYAHELAQKMADAAMRKVLPELEYPEFTVPVYFDLPKDEPQQ